MKSGLTINELVEMAYGTAKANGFHDQDHLPVTPEDAPCQIASMGFIIPSWANAVEAIRKSQTALTGEQLSTMVGQVRNLQSFGPIGFADGMMSELQLEHWQVRLISWLALTVTELAEAMVAVTNRDKANFAEELADTVIRIGDILGGLNADPDHPFGGIDLEATILAKNERNKRRGYRHGGKRA